VLGFSGLLCVEWAILRVSSFSHQICGSFFNLTYIVFLSKPTVRSWWQCRGSYCSLALASVMKVIDNLWVTHWGLRWVMRIKTTHSCSASFSFTWAGWTVPSTCCLGVFSAISNICDYTQHTRHWLKNQCCGVKWQQMSALYIYSVQWLWCWACIMTACGEHVTSFLGTHYISHWGGGLWHLQKRCHPPNSEWAGL
jgi:hypothetical protein